MSCVFLAVTPIQRAKTKGGLRSPRRCVHDCRNYVYFLSSVRCKWTESVIRDTMGLYVMGSAMLKGYKSEVRIYLFYFRNKCKVDSSKINVGYNYSKSLMCAFGDLDLIRLFE